MKNKIEKVDSNNGKNNIYYGLYYGYVVWLVYAIVECTYISILPGLIKPAQVYKQVHYGFTSLTFLIYPLIGLIIGLLITIGYTQFARKQHIKLLSRERIFYAFSIGLFVLVFNINLLINMGIGSLFICFSLLISFVLILIIILTAFSEKWSLRFSFIANPWALSVILIGLVWVPKTLTINQSKFFRAISTLAFLLFIIVLFYLITKLLKGRGDGKNNTLKMNNVKIKTIFVLTPIALVVLGLSFLFKQSPYIAPKGSDKIVMEKEKSNVILIVMDTVRADHVSMYGYDRDTTPNIQKFSEQATLYAKPIATGNMTLSTHASIFTGLYIREHGAHSDVNYPYGRPLSDSFDTLAEILSKKGFETLAVVANYAYLSPSFGLHQGFDYFDYRSPVIFLGKVEGYFIRAGLRTILSHFFPIKDWDKVFKDAEQINEEAYKLISEVKKKENNFLLFINYMDAHPPYIPKAPFDCRYPGKMNSFTEKKYYDLQKEVLQLKHNVTKEEYDHLISQYDGGIAFIDFHIGKLIEELKKLDLYENSTIIITSDHGEAFGKNNYLGHWVSTYQNQVYVPLIIKYPYQKEGKVENEYVSSIDLLPTIMNILGYNPTLSYKGKNLYSMDDNNNREVISEHYPNGGILQWHKISHRNLQAIYSEEYKYIKASNGEVELYDISSDPEENINIARQNENVANLLDSKLTEWLSKTTKYSESSSGLDQEQLNRLKSLGYLK